MSSSKQQPKTMPEVDSAYESNQPPWPEWDDAFINAMQWTNIPTKPTPKTSPKNDEPNFTLSVDQEAEDLFEDPAGLLELPEEMKVESWVRPHHYYPNSNVVLQPDSNPDLVTHNRHLMKYQVVRLIVGSIMCLVKEATHRPFSVEFQSSQYVAIGGDEWKPWHHVYALSKAGKGKTHTIAYNSFGKYVVRLFYMGKWRCLLVDDRLPLSKEGLLLLPISCPNNLWLPLLTKALLRVASLSWSEHNDAGDVSIVHCLTGWIPTIVPCRGVSQNQLWCVCCQMMGTTEEVVHSPGCCDRANEHPKQPADLPAVGSRMILACSMFPLYHSSAVRKTMTRLEHLLLIKNAKFDNNLASPLWKEHRWNDWAFNKNVISDIPLRIKRNLLIYDPLIMSHSSSDSTDETAKEDELWINFDVFIPLMRYLEVYYKPSYFKYRLLAWTLPDLLSLPQCAMPNKNQLQRMSKSKGPKPDKTNKDKGKGEKIRSSVEKFANNEESPANLHNPPLFYLVIDSMECKQLYFSLSAYNPDKLTNAHIITGKFEWFSSSVAPVVFRLTTRATRGYVLALCPGLHAFRIWHRFPQHFCLQIYSNTQFCTVNKNSVHHILSADSYSYSYYGSEISAKFEALLSAPEGGAEHGERYSQLMTCLRPPRLEQYFDFLQLLPAQAALEQAFEESLVEMLTESNEELEEMYKTLQTFQMLFLNPVFGEKILMEIKRESYEFIENCKIAKKEIELKRNGGEVKEGRNSSKKQDKEKTPKSVKDKSEAASPSKSPKTSIKSKIPKRDSKKKSVTGGIQLKKRILCNEKSLLLNNPSNAIILLRKITTKVSNLKKFYPFGSEDDFRLVFQDYVGEVKVIDDWVVLVRCVLNIHSVEPVPCSLHLWSPAEEAVLHLIDNDTLRDVPLGFVENRVGNLSRNNNGYTVIAYCKACEENQPWRLRSVGVSETNTLHLCNGLEWCEKYAVLPEQHQQTVHGFYVPNKDNLIARCVLEVQNDVTVLLRLGLSSATARCSFVIFDQQDNYVVNSTGTNHILLPILFLKGPEHSSSDDSVLTTLYKVEVRVVDDSWPLSEDQCKAMLLYKENLPDTSWFTHEKRRTGVPGDFIESVPVNQHAPEESEINFFKNTAKPTWSLTVVTDLQETLPVQLRLDTTVWEELLQLESRWLSPFEDTDKCHQLRQDFVQKLKEEEEDDDGWSEETVFHLVAKKTEQLTKLYGELYGVETSQTLSAPRNSVGEWSLSSLCSKCYKLCTKGSLTSSNNWRLSSLCEECYHSVISRAEASQEHVEANEVEDNKTMLAQQACIHMALENMRIRNKEHFKQIFEATNKEQKEVCSKIQAMKQEAMLSTKPAKSSKLEKKKRK